MPLEKRPLDKNAQRTPEIPDENDSTFIPSANEEAVLAKLHETNEKHKSGAHSHEELEVFHKDIEHCECYPVFQQYLSGEIPTLDRMFGQTAAFLETYKKGLDAQEHDKDAHSAYSLLVGRESQIRSSVQRYVQSVIRFNRLRKLSLDGARDLSKQFQDADHSRRRAHNELITSLQLYAQLVTKAEEAGYHDSKTEFPYVFWDIAEDARNISPNKTVLFNAQVMQNRDFIKEWAIAADFAEQLESLGDGDWLNSIRDRSAK